MLIALSLLKRRFHLSFAALIAAALLFGPPPDEALAVRLAAI